MDHTGNRWQGVVHTRQHGIERGRVRNVRKLDFDSESACSQRRNCLFRDGSGARRPFNTIVPAPRSASHPASTQPIPPQSTCYQVSSVMSQLSGCQGRHCQYNFADVPGCAHEIHRGACFGERPSSVPERYKFAFFPCAQAPLSALN